MIAIFLFYNIATGVQAGLSCSEEFKHCNIIIYDGADWLMLDFDRCGYRMRRINAKSGVALLRNLKVVKEITAIVSLNISDRKSIKWLPFLVRSCNEICRYVAGVDIGLTFNPIHLYYKLLKYRHSRNYEVMSAWRRKKHGILGRRQRAGQ